MTTPPTPGRPDMEYGRYHGSAKYVVMIRGRRSYYKELWMIVVAEEDLQIIEGQHEGMDRPVDVIAANHG